MESVADSPPIVDSFETIYRSQVAAVFGYAAARLGRGAAEDITAEVFHAAVQRIRSGADVSPAWLMTVTRNKVIDHWRRAERQQRWLRLVHSVKEAPDPAHEVAAGEMRRDIVAALDQSSKHRLLLLLHYVDGPVVVVTAREILDESVNVVQVVPLTSTVRPFGSEVEIKADAGNGLEADAAAQCQHIRSVSVDRVESVRGNAGVATLSEIREVLALILDIN